MDNNFDLFVRNALANQGGLKFIDLFCGIGGFHTAGKSLGMKCIFASDIDTECRKSYEENYGLKPQGDIYDVSSEEIPDHDILFAGFPCQPFSIIGERKGFDDNRGVLFEQIARILNDKNPKAFVLENVKQLKSHNKGQTLNHIIYALESLGYKTDFRVLDARDFGLPQKRERIIIVGFLEKSSLNKFKWPTFKIKMKPLSDILEINPPESVFVSDRIRKKRKGAHSSKAKPSIWHENKSGNISSYLYSCALRAGASYNYLLVDGERRLTTREMLRLQGFPDTFKIVCNESRTRKQAGNSVPVPMVQAVIAEVKKVVEWKSKNKRIPAENRATVS